MLGKITQFLVEKLSTFKVISQKSHKELLENTSLPNAFWA